MPDLTPDWAERVLGERIIKACAATRKPYVVRHYTAHDHTSNSRDALAGGQRYRVQVDTANNTIETVAMVCQSVQREAVGGYSNGPHVHGESCKLVATPFRHRWWHFATHWDAIVAVLRWDPTTEGEPYGWIEAHNNRTRPTGEILSEQTTRLRYA